MHELLEQLKSSYVVRRTDGTLWDTKRNRSMKSCTYIFVPHPEHEVFSFEVDFADPRPETTSLTDGVSTILSYLIGSLSIHFESIPIDIEFDRINLISLDIE